MIADPPQPVTSKRNTRGRTAKESAGIFIENCSMLHWYNVYALCLCVNNVLTPDRQARGQSVESERSPVIVDPPQPVKSKRNTRGRTAKESAGRFIENCSMLRDVL